MSQSKKRILLLDDNRDLASRYSYILARNYGVIVDTPANSNEAIDMMTRDVYNIIYIDRGLSYRLGRVLIEEDGLELAKAIRGQGDYPERCSEILAANREAYLIVSSGMRGFARGSISGINYLLEKENSRKSIINAIEMGLGVYEKTSEDKWEEAKGTMSALEEHLHNELAFSSQSLRAGEWLETRSLEGFYLELLQHIRDRDNPESPYKDFLKDAEKKFHAQKRLRRRQPKKTAQP